jgi:hypothetical protein
MSPAHVVETVLIAAHFTGLVTLCLVDPAGLVEAKYGQQSDR